MSASSLAPPASVPAPTRRPAGTLSELWQHRQLLWQFTLRNLELRHKGSLLGIAWTFATPLISLLIYVIVFGYIFGGNFPEDPINTKASYALAVFLGLSMFHFIAEVIGITPSVILTSPNLVKKVRFPLSVLPAAATGSAFIHFLVSLCLFGIAAQVMGIPVWSKVGWLFVLLPPLALIALGTAFLLAAIGVFIRDVGQMTQFFNLILLYASAIFFSVTDVPAAIWQFLRFNPVLQTINETRQVLLWNAPLNLHHLGYTYLTGALALALGCWLFRKLRDSFPDAI